MEASQLYLTFSKLSCPQIDKMNVQYKFCYMLICQFIIDIFDSRPVP